MTSGIIVRMKKLLRVAMVTPILVFLFLSTSYSEKITDSELKLLRNSLNKPATMFDIGIVYLQLQLSTVVTNQSRHMNVPMSLDTNIDLKSQKIKFTVVVDPRFAKIVPACDGLRKVIRNRFLETKGDKGLDAASIRLMERAFSHRVAGSTEQGLRLASLMVARTELAVKSGKKTCRDRINR